MSIRIYLLILLSLVSLPGACFSVVVDGGRGVVRAGDKDVVLTIGSSLEFPEFSSEYALWSLCGEIGAAIHESSVSSSRDTEFVGIVGLELLFSPHARFFPRVRVLSNVVDLFKTNKKIGWAIEGGIIIPVTYSFWLTFNVGRGTAFSMDRTVQTYFPTEVIIRGYWHLR